MTQTSDPNSKDQNVRHFLIIDGERVYTIDRMVLSIGRKNDNHIVIDNEHVSRYHAQIQIVDGNFILLDLGSTVGTSVNGNPIKQYALKPGDVISLGGVPIIFGQGPPRDHLQASYSEQEKSKWTGPTDALDINKVDQYLELFNKPEEDDPKK